MRQSFLLEYYFPLLMATELALCYQVVPIFQHDRLLRRAHPQVHPPPLQLRPLSGLERGEAESSVGVQMLQMSLYEMQRSNGIGGYYVSTVVSGNLSRKDDFIVSNLQGSVSRITVFI